MPPRKNHALDKWIARYEREIASRLKACPPKQRPKREHPLSAGHMYFNEGRTPRAAATAYINGSKYGRQACTRRPR